MTTIPSPRKIAVVRVNALGDYLYALPALQALRDSFPHAEIVYLGNAWHKTFLENRPGPVDRVVVVPPYPGVGAAENTPVDTAALDAFFINMQREAFDIAIQLHGGGKNSNPFVWKLGAGLTLGLKTPDAVALDISVPYVYYFSEILRNLEVVGRLGIKPRSLEPRITVTPQDMQEVRQVTGSNTNRIAVIHPGVTDIRRCWPGSRFAAIANYLAEQGMTVYITGIETEQPLIEALMQTVRYPSAVHNVCGRLSLNGMTGLLSLASLVISNDTGPLHLARALQTPTIGLYWCGNMINGMPMTTALHRSLLSWTTRCPLCGTATKHFHQGSSGCTHATSFVAEITTAEVIETIHEMMRELPALTQHPQVQAPVLNSFHNSW